jgi:hypothetical protein
VEFESYEWQSVRKALAALGVPHEIRAHRGRRTRRL